VAAGNGVLSGAWNFRDVAEEAAIRPGRFFRSSELSRLSEDGRRRLTELGITDVADLRSPNEVERRGPGQVPDGVVVHRLPFQELDATRQEAPHEKTFEKMMSEKADDESVEAAARRFMAEEYRRFATLPGALSAVRGVVSLLSGARPVITHCFAGKDRTGFTVAVVLEAAGIGRDAILADFLRSNTAVPQLRTRLLEMIQTRTANSMTAEAVTFAEARLTDEVLGVREEYLDAARRSIDENYGSLGEFLDAAGVIAKDLAALRTQLLG
jgi:protein-tyrosine phosphatase